VWPNSATNSGAKDARIRNVSCSSTSTIVPAAWYIVRYSATIGVREPVLDILVRLPYFAARGRHRFAHAVSGIPRGFVALVRHLGYRALR